MECHKSISWWKIGSNETFVTPRMIQYYKKRNGLPMLCKNKLEPDNYPEVLFKLTIIYSEPKIHFLPHSPCLVLNVLSAQYSHCYHLLQFHSIDRKSETHTKVNQVLPIFFMLLFSRLWWLKLSSEPISKPQRPSHPESNDHEGTQRASNVSVWPGLMTGRGLMTFLFWPLGLIRPSGKRDKITL